MNLNIVVKKVIILQLIIVNKRMYNEIILQSKYKFIKWLETNNVTFSVRLIGAVLGKLDRKNVFSNSSAKIMENR